MLPGLEAVSAVVYGVALVVYVAVRYGDALLEDDPGRVEQAQRAYLDHDSVAQLEADLDRALRVEHAEGFRRDLERIPHIGPETSAAIVSRFQSRRSLRRASREEITGINGVGPSIYESLRERYGSVECDAEVASAAAEA